MSRVLAAGLGLVLAGLGLRPAAAEPGPDPGACEMCGPGPFPAARARDEVAVPGPLGALPVTVTYPAAPGPGSVAPVVLLSGFLLAPADHAPYAERLASHGYLVVQYDAPPLLPDTQELALLAPLRAALPALAARLPGFDAGALDASALGVAGYSRGGKLAALHLAGGGADAAFLVCPVDIGGGGGRAGPSALEALRGRGLRLGVAGAGHTGPCNPEGRNWRAFAAEAGPGSWAQEVVAAGHAHFALPGQPRRAALRWLCGGSAALASRDAIGLVLPALVGFLEQELRGRDASRVRGWLQGQGGVRFEVLGARGGPGAAGGARAPVAAAR